MVLLGRLTTSSTVSSTDFTVSSTFWVTSAFEETTDSTIIFFVASATRPGVALISSTEAKATFFAASCAEVAASIAAVRSLWGIFFTLLLYRQPFPLQQVGPY